MFTALTVLALGCSKDAKPPESAPVPPVTVPTAPMLPQVPEGPPVPAEVTTIAFGSCLQQVKEAPILGVIEASEPDVLVLLGDNVYGDVKTDDPLLPELRAAYATLAGRSDFAGLVSSVPLLVTWDDHDYGLNDAGASFAGKAYAEQLFEHFWRIPEDSIVRSREGVYDVRTFGEGERTVQVLLLDLRTFKSDFLPTPEHGKPGAERYVPSDEGAPTMLGTDQWTWLTDELANPAALRIVVSSMQVHADGHGWERWGLFPAERDRLYAALAARNGGSVVIVSGDRHRAGIYERPDLPGGPYPEMTTSSLNLSFGGDEEAGPHRLGPTFTGENFGTIQLDWEAGKIALAVRDGSGGSVLAHEASLP